MGDDGLAAFARLGPGARVGGYTIVRLGGRGGMAVVWLAHDDATGERVALKTMMPGFSMRSEHERLFLAEGRIASRIDHANVCRVRDVGEDAGVRYIAMDWIRGGSLASLMGACGGGLPVGIAMRVIADVARGLEAAHTAKDDDGAPLGIVHRDVSPQNVLVSGDGRATVADFGVAKMLSGDGTYTASGFVKGKVRYMAPEQAYAEPVDARTDVFALGIVLCEAATGRHPFASETDVATLATIASGKPVPLPEDGLLPAELLAIIAKAVQQEPADRFPTMGAFAEALEAFDEARLEGPTTREEVGRFVRDTLPESGDDDVVSPTGRRGSRSRSRQRAGVALAAATLLAFAAWRGIGSTSEPRGVSHTTAAPSSGAAILPENERGQGVPPRSENALPSANGVEPPPPPLPSPRAPAPRPVSALVRAPVTASARSADVPVPVAMPSPSPSGSSRPRDVLRTRE